MNNGKATTHYNLFVGRTKDIDNDRYYASLYKVVDRSLHEGYAVVYGLEPEPQTTIDRMLRYGIDAHDFLDKGALDVIDREVILSLSNTSANGRKLAENLVSLTGKVQKGQYEEFL